MGEIFEFMIPNRSSREGEKARRGNARTCSLRGFAPSRETKSILISQILLFFTFASCLHAQDSSLIMHQTSFNGGLFLTFPIIDFQLGDDLKIAISASHETRYNSSEDSTRSYWELAGLTTYLVCNEKNQLVWRSPTGDMTYFDKALLAKQKNVVSKGCMLVATGEDEYVVADNHSRKWFYRRGSLEKVTYAKSENKRGDAKDDEVTFKCSNGMIREMSYNNKVFFSVRQQGSMLLCFVKDQQIADIQYDVTGQLIEYINFADKRWSAVKFTYEGSNLVEINAENEGVERFVWKEIGLWQRWFSLLQYPVYLYSDGDHTYAHGCYFGRAKITATDAAGGREVKVLNLKSGVITDRK